METSLHRDLKRLYAGRQARVEVRVAGYRIDAVVDGELVEIQHGSLGAIRRKVQDLLGEYSVKVVKPLVANKLLCKRGRRGGRAVERRRSPKRGKLLDAFDELIFFTRVFPHPRLTLEFVLVDVEEWRHPGHGRRRWRRPGDFIIEDQRLVAVHSAHVFRTAADLRALIPCQLPSPFNTAQLATGLAISRTLAQRIAYCMRHLGTIAEVGKSGNSRLYKFRVPRRAAS